MAIITLLQGVSYCPPNKTIAVSDSKKRKKAWEFRFRLQIFRGAFPSGALLLMPFSDTDTLYKYVSRATELTGARRIYVTRCGSEEVVAGKSACGKSMQIRFSSQSCCWPLLAVSFPLMAFSFFPMRLTKATSSFFQPLIDAIINYGMLSAPLW